MSMKETKHTFASFCKLDSQVVIELFANRKLQSGETMHRWQKSVSCKSALTVWSASWKISSDEFEIQNCITKTNHQ